MMKIPGLILLQMIPFGVFDPGLGARDEVDNFFEYEVMLLFFIRDPDKYRLL
jgi:hypothetical protein